MQFHRRSDRPPFRLGILSGAFHPPTRAHVALAQAALAVQETDEVLFVLPAAFPHKQYEGISMDQRLDLLAEAVRHEPRFSIAITKGGLFLEIARECRTHYGSVRLSFLCGRDAAERIVNWNYDGHPPIEKQLAEYELLVAPRQGVYQPPPHLAASIRTLPVEPCYDEVSSSQVRQRIVEGGDWSHLVPDAIVERVKRLYS